VWEDENEEVWWERDELRRMIRGFCCNEDDDKVSSFREMLGVRFQKGCFLEDAFAMDSEEGGRAEGGVIIIGDCCCCCCFWWDVEEEMEEDEGDEIKVGSDSKNVVVPVLVVVDAE
jgi:hypothetical protein